MKQHKWHKEIKAWADGAEIEWKYIEDEDDDDWLKADSPNFDSDDLEFRIKPQPKDKNEVFKQIQEHIELNMYGHAWDKCQEMIEKSEEKPQPKEPQCKKHKDAPHGFCRDASESEDRYVCECEYWEEPKEPQYLYVYRVENKIRIAEPNTYFECKNLNDIYCIGKIKLEVEDD